MQSTMQDRPLTITVLLEHGRTVHAGSEVVTWEEAGPRRASFAAVAEDAARLAGALRRLGIREGDRVGTFCWNSAEHLAAYFAVPCLGAVLHTVNIRLFPEQLTYVVNHAADRVLLVDDSLVPVLAKVAPTLETVEHFVVVGDGDAAALGPRVLRWRDLLAAEAPRFPWPDLDERAAAAMCYTSGTTGNPKGVVYSHRSTFLHSLATNTGNVWAFGERDRILLIVPMFHANAWGMPYSAWASGADLLMPGRFLQAAPLARMIAEERPTVSAAVPTIWNDLYNHLETHPTDLSSLRVVCCGGSAVPRSLIEKFERTHGVRVVQAWGMTETSPLAAVAHPPKGTPVEEDVDWRARTGRVVAGVELRIVDDANRPVPTGTAGEVVVRSPAVMRGYWRDPAATAAVLDAEGWVHTGDVGVLDAAGYLRLRGRRSEMFIRGGFNVYPAEIEDLLARHPAVARAAVVGVAEPVFGEVGWAFVVPRDPARPPTLAELRAFVGAELASFKRPDGLTILAELPVTPMFKVDKAALRALRHE